MVTKKMSQPIITVHGLSVLTVSHSWTFSLTLGFNENLEGAFVSSWVEGGAFMARVGAIFLGSNSSDVPDV